MRIRIILLLAALLTTAALVALNWPEFVRPTPVSLGFTIVEMPLPLLLLVALLLALLGGMGNAAWTGARHEREMSMHMRELQAQRNLADKAEASRFTELRHYLDLQVSEARQREAVTAEALQATLIKGQRDMQASVEAMSSRLAAQMALLQTPLSQTEQAPVPHSM